MKNIIKKIIPYPILLFFKTHVERVKLLTAYAYDSERFLIHSSIRRYDNDYTKLISTIVRNYHVIEKGLTMPESRLGFGADRMVKLINECVIFINSFDKNDEQLKHAISVILEYKELHDSNNYPLNARILTALDRLNKLTVNAEAGSQKIVSRDEYFKHRLSSFDLFSNSRSSIRNYGSDEVSLDSLNEALELARNTPSACNRQTSRCYIYNDKTQILEILNLQGGNRGFGHLANKLIVMTAETGVFNSIAERNQAFIDGGMYAMNVLYALHHHRIAGCILNCSTTPKKDKELRKLCKISDSEVFIAMISCGIPPETFKVAASKRYELRKTAKFIDVDKNNEVSTTTI